VAHSAEIWDDIVEICGDEDDQDNVVDTFPTEGRDLDQVRAELTRRYGALAPTHIVDNRGQPIPTPPPW
jgi:hypothetical protein